MEIQETIVSYLWVLFVTYVTAVDSSLQEVERHLEMGKLFLSKGQFADALTHYHAAVDLDPDNYQTLYRRATVYLATGKSKSAIPDLDRVVELKPDFVSARLQRGNVLLKQCDLEGAEHDFRAVLHASPGNAEAQEKLDSIPNTDQYIEEGNTLMAEGDLMTAEQYFTKAIEVCPWNAELRENRARCYEEMGDIQKAIADIRGTTKLIQDSTEAFYKLAKLYYLTGDTEESLNHVRECLKLNPDHKRCFPHYKQVKKLVKFQQSVKDATSEENWEECLDKVESIYKNEPEVESIRMDADVFACKCNSKAGNSDEAITICSEVIGADETNFRALCDRAEAYILNEQFDDAINDYQAALKISEENRRAREGLNRAQKLLKQSKRKDYYKILGVRRNADKRQITKAYRKLAQKWHPDNFSDSAEKKKAESKFIDIASAKEVLTDPEKRQKFDNGEDPLDPEQQQQHAHPFYGFNPFGGGGGSFKFHFQ